MFDVDDENDPQNKAQNEKLQALAESGIPVIVMRRDFESVIRTTNGEDAYRRLTQKYPSLKKPTKQRLIACDLETSIPEEIVKLFAGVDG